MGPRISVARVRVPPFAAVLCASIATVAAATEFEGNVPITPLSAPPPAAVVGAVVPGLKPSLLRYGGADVTWKPADAAGPAVVRIGGDETQVPAGLFFRYTLGSARGHSVEVRSTLLAGVQPTCRVRSDGEPGRADLTGGGARSIVDATWIEVLVYGDAPFECAVSTVRVEALPLIGNWMPVPRQPLFGPNHDRTVQLEAGERGLKRTGVLGIAAADMHGSSFSRLAWGDDVGVYFMALALGHYLRIGATDAMIFLVCAIYFGSLITAALLLRRRAARWWLWLIALVPLGWLLRETRWLHDVYPMQVAAPLILTPLFWLWITSPAVADGAPGRAALAKSALAFTGLFALCAVMNYLRSHMGTMMAGGMIVGLLLHRGLPRRRRLVIATAGVAGALVVMISVGQYLDYRDAMLARLVGNDLPQHTDTHPVWHPVYGGLGYRANPYGIRWDDELIAAHAFETDPEAAYLSPEYEAALRERYLDIARSDPLFVIGTYFAKFCYVLDQRKRATFLVLLGLGAVLCDRRYWAFDAGMLVATGLSMGPAVVGLPDPMFLIGYLATAAAYAAVGILRIGEAVVTRPARARRPVAVEARAAAGSSDDATEDSPEDTSATKEPTVGVAS